MHRRLHAPSPMHEHSTNSRGSARTRSWRIVNASASRIPMSVRPLARGSFRGVSKDVFHQPKDTSWSIRLIELNDGVPRVRRTDRLLACPTARRSRQQPKAWCESGKWAPVQRSRPCACFSHCSPIFTWLWEVAVFGSAISRKFYVNPLSLYLQWQCYSLIKANSLHLTDKLAQPGEETRPQKKKVVQLWRFWDSFRSLLVYRHGKIKAPGSWASAFLLHLVSGRLRKCAIWNEVMTYEQSAT